MLQSCLRLWRAGNACRKSRFAFAVVASFSGALISQLPAPDLLRERPTALVLSSKYIVQSAVDIIVVHVSLCHDRAAIGELVRDGAVGEGDARGAVLVKNEARPVRADLLHDPVACLGRRMPVAVVCIVAVTVGMAVAIGVVVVFEAPLPPG